MGWGEAQEPHSGVTVLPEDAKVIADLVRIGCAALAAMPIAVTDAVGGMRRQRQLRIGKAFLDVLDPDGDGDGQKATQNSLLPDERSET